MKDAHFIVGFIVTQITDLLLPYIDHYVVVFGIGEKNDILVLDPDDGIQLLTEIEFRKMWKMQGQAVLLIAP